MAIFKSPLLLLLSFFLFLNVYAKQSSNSVHWGYDGAVGPDAWGTLSPDYKLCSRGKSQSPIDIEVENKNQSQNLEAIQFGYKSSSIDILNSGHDIKLTYKNGSKILFEKKEYELLQFHFHAPAEHTIHGKRADIEAHFVHSDKEGNLVVVGLMINKGKMNYALRDIFNHIPQQVGAVNSVKDKKINPLDFFPKEGGYYTYTGSFTTPPCSVNVKWIILDTPIEASLDQIMKLTKIYRMNSRPIQPLNGRKILQKL